MPPSALMAEENAIAMLPQPFVTTAQAQSESLRVALDLTEEWDALQADSETPSTLVTGVVVPRTTFAEEHPEVVSAFLDHYQESVDYVNPTWRRPPSWWASMRSSPPKVARKARRSATSSSIEGDEMKEKLSGYLSVLFEQNLSPWAAPCLTTPSTSAADLHERPPNHTGLGCTLLVAPVAGGARPLISASSWSPCSLCWRG